MSSPGRHVVSRGREGLHRKREQSTPQLRLSRLEAVPGRRSGPCFDTGTERAGYLKLTYMFVSGIYERGYRERHPVGRAVPSPLPCPAGAKGEAGALRAEGRLQPPLLPPERPVLGGHGPRPRGDRKGDVQGRSKEASRVSAVRRDPRGSGARHRARVGAEADRDDPALEDRAPRAWRRHSPADEDRVLAPRPGGRRGARQRRPERGSRVSTTAVPGQPLRCRCGPAAEDRCAGRPARTQARDVFDLHLLLAGGAPRPVRDDEATARACANALSVDFGTFRSQVLSYLEPDARSQYDSPSAWDAVVLEVVDALRGEPS